MTNVVPINPKPSGEKKRAGAPVRFLRNGAEICNQLTKDGRDEYVRRKRIMWERQGRICCLYGHIASCPKDLNWSDAVFAHEIPKGHGGGSHDDRIEVNGRRQNGVAHSRCNYLQGSRRIDFNAAYNNQPFELTDRTTPSGKVLFQCKLCGHETPAPTKNHQCGGER